MDAATATSVDDSAPPTTAASVSPTLVGGTLKEDKEVLDDAQAQVIVSLRAQIQDLISQVTQLNGKLVKSYDRVSDVEDELHIASSSARYNSLKISELEIERAQHLAALNTGLYVEKAHVTAELTRLMERATAEAAARGQAETARENIETELDDLSANLFSQANSMVVEARLGRAMSERKVVDAEMALKSAEEAVGMMQLQMQSLRDDKDRTADENSRLKTLVEKGKFVEHAPITSMATLKLLSSHAPYQEFLLFVLHLRSVRPSTVHPPHISTFLPLPFLARLQTEDSDPTVRLDFAPSLNWLSRRSVLQAIYAGQLTIEPMSVSALLLEPSHTLQSMMAGSHSTLACALCGTQLLPQPKSDQHPHPPSHPLSTLTRNTGNWSTSLFKYPLSTSMSAAPSPPLTPPPYSPSAPTTVYVFRLAQTQVPSNPAQAAQKPTNYPLCGSGWCLTRLRTTCSLWAFIRAGVIDRIWEEELPASTHAPSVSSASVYSVNSSAPRLTSTASLPKPSPEKEKAPPLPPRRRSKMSSVGASVGNLWGMASNALKSQPASPSRSTSKEEKDLPTPAPEPKAPESPARRPPGEGLRVTVPPPLPRRSTDRSAAPKSNDSPSDPEKSEANERTPVAQTMQLEPVPPVPPLPAGLPTSTQIMPTLSKSSSSMGEEFSTPVEELNALSLANGIPGSPRSPRSPTSPRSPVVAPLSPRASRSPSPRSPTGKSHPPPRSPRRLSSPPPPSSPHRIPLPESRPGTPFKTHSRQGSASVTSPLNVMAGQSPNVEGAPGLPSRTDSPAPGGAVAPPPVPRRAAARRAVPPPPESSGTPMAPAPTSAEEREPVSPEETKADSPVSTTEAEEKPVTDGGDEPHSQPAPATSGPPPPLPPRHPDQAQRNRSEPTPADGDTVGKADGGDAMEEKQGRPRSHIQGKKRESDPSSEMGAGPYVGDASWEERTWKEIVRLREDMFWARVGGLRV